MPANPQVWACPAFWTSLPLPLYVFYFNPLLFIKLRVFNFSRVWQSYEMTNMADMPIEQPVPRL